MFSLSSKSITLLLSVGVASATGSKPRLRHRRAAVFNHGHDAPASAGPDQNLRNLYASGSSAASPVGSEDIAAAQLDAAASASARPSLALDKDVYQEGEPITVTFSVGSPSDPYYSSSEAPSLAVDYDYPKYSVGLFMRDADPQGGALAPIVSISACGALGPGCDADDRDHASYGGVSVAFGEESLALMDGRWPLEVASYGTGFDAYVLDGRGAAAIGPLGFYIEEGDGEDVDATREYSAEQPFPEDASSSLSTAGSPIPSRLADNPLLKYQKGILKAPEHQHTTVSKGAAASQAKANVLEVDAEGEGAEISPGTIESGEEEYEADAPVSIEFSVPSGEDLTGYKIGIFMRMAHPQGGALSPVVSLPLCPEDGSGSCDTADNLTTGSATFSSKTMDLMTGSPWPIDVSQWGTGFDAYILDSTGDGVVGPAKFNIVVDDTY